LQALRVSSAASSAPVLRQAVYWLEELALAGPAALPAIGEFLARYEDADLAADQFQSRSTRERPPLDFALPPSLRFGLFNVLRRIGGADAEKILAESLARTGRGVEVAYLAGALQEMAPDKYRQALTVARALWPTAPFMGRAAGPRHRDYLFGVLRSLATRALPAARHNWCEPTARSIRLKYLQRALAFHAHRCPSVSESAADKLCRQNRWPVWP
jgi:hypothetical protein